MTRVRVRVRVPGGDTGTLPAPGEILFQPTARHTNGDDIVLPAPMRCRLDPSGCTLVDLPPSQLPRWCWKAVERTLGGTTRYVDVPDSPDELEYAALTDVDPKTLQAKPPDESAWNALFQRIEDLVDAAASAQPSGNADFFIDISTTSLWSNHHRSRRQSKTRHNAPQGLGPWTGGPEIRRSSVQARAAPLTVEQTIRLKKLSWADSEESPSFFYVL